MSEQLRNPYRLDAEEFDAWRSHPTTQRVMKHLGDIEAALREAWRQGNDWTVEAKQSVYELENFQALTFEQIEEFYPALEEEEEEEDE